MKLEELFGDLELREALATATHIAVEWEARTRTTEGKYNELNSKYEALRINRDDLWTADNERNKEYLALSAKYEVLRTTAQDIYDRWKADPDNEYLADYAAHHLFAALKDQT